VGYLKDLFARYHELLSGEAVTVITQPAPRRVA
jgi:hypothetical protein